MISFNAIPVGIRTPGSYVEFSNIRAQKGLALWDTKMLIVGQQLAAGSGAPLTPTLITSAQQAINLFGRGSMLARMCAAALVCNSVTPLWALGVVDNGAGVAATQTITFTAQPTAAGSLPLYVEGVAVPVAVTSGMTLAAMATATVAAINANPDLPVTAAAVAGVVTTTCRWKGLTGNDVDIRTAYQASDVMPAGLALTIAAGTAGATNPDATAAIAALGDTQYNFIAWPWTDNANLALLTTEMANRRGPMEQIEGSAFASAKGSQGTLAALGESLNSPDLSLSECVGPMSTWLRAARECAIIAYYGSIDPARPFQTLALIGDAAGNATERFTRAQRDALLHDGISTHTVDAGGDVLLERPITTYELNPLGAPDASYLDVNTLLTLAYLRFTLRARISQKYPRHKLADDGTPIAAGQAIVTPKILQAELNALAQEWEDAGLVDNLAEFQQLLVVQRNANDPSRIDALIPPDIIGQLRVFAGQIQFAF